MIGEQIGRVTDVPGVVGVLESLSIPFYAVADSPPPLLQLYCLFSGNGKIGFLTGDVRVRIHGGKGS